MEWSLELGRKGRALAQIFNSNCVTADRRARLERLRDSGLDIRCRRFLPACAVAKGFGTAAIMTLASRTIPGHRAADSRCLAGPDPLASVILHEIIHFALGEPGEVLPDSCEYSCFGTPRGQPPDLCQNPQP
jgi:hypothetical protein